MAAKSIGLYIHVPFCLRKCSYCAFASSRKPDDISGMCSALRTEFLARTRDSNQVFRTFYAGGGTPTLLPPEFWSRFIASVRTHHLKEVTIETNPAVLDGRGYSTLLLAGFNRISLGVQSFKDIHLKRLGRMHNSEQAREALKIVRDTGFSNISADLMYGLPEQTLKDQQEDLEELLRFRPEHISVYELTLEKGTPMGDAGEKASEEQCADMYYQAHRLLTENGYVHYEVSNYALGESYRSKHNSSYWDRTPYIGIGPSAHSFTGTRRTWNHSDSKRYESAVIRGESPIESGEDITGENGAHEILALGFRHTGGVNLNDLERIGFSLDPDNLISTGLVQLVENRIVPNETGMLFADRLALEASELLKSVPGFDGEPV